MNSTYKIGDKVMVTAEGQEAEVVKVHADGDIEVRFVDGEQGSYSPNEVEAL